MITIVEVKYTKQAIPELRAFYNKDEARKFAQEKEQNNPYVRWTKVQETETEIVDLKVKLAVTKELYRRERERVSHRNMQIKDLKQRIKNLEMPLKKAGINIEALEESL